MASPMVTRFFGGPPLAVLLKLLLLSLFVGAVLFWLDVRPQDIINGVYHFGVRIWQLGFDGLRQAGEYIFAGAIIVIPIWLVMRVMRTRAPLQ